MEKSTDYPLVADTSALVSLATKTDHNHGPAVAAAANLRKMQRSIILPTDVLSETLNVLGKRSGRQTALQAAANLLHERGQFVLLETTAHIPAALDKFTRLPPAVSFTDCLVMAVADHYRTRDIFGFDKQFADAGYRRLTPSSDWSSSV